MVDVTQEGRPLLETPQHSHRPVRRPSQNPIVLECNKLYGFEISDAALERTDWTFSSPDSLKISEVNSRNYERFITTFQDQDGTIRSQQDRTYLKLLYAPWKKSLLIKGSFEDTKLPVEAETRKLAQERRWITDEYRHLWHNNSGGSAVLTEVGKSGFILQTPNDDEPFCSLSISEFQPTGSNTSSCGGVYLADEDEEYSLKNLLGSTSIQDYCPSGNDSIICKFHVLSMLLPVRILQKHTAATRKRLVDLAKELTVTEERIACLSEDIALGNMMQSTEKDNRLLNEMNLKHMKFHRRWNFELELGASILRYFDMAAARDNGKHKHNVQAYTKAMGDQVERQIRSSESLKYDFDTIPRRIRNQSKALFNLMIQRDNQLNLSIAEHSRHLNKINTDIAKSSQQIAVESRRDNASMKTIAVLTLIFLPGTFVASIFSMQMFNWQAGQPGQGDQIVSSYFWIYWAITIPLTTFVLIGWLIFDCFFQKPRTTHIEDIERKLPPLPPKRIDLTFKYE